MKKSFLLLLVFAFCGVTTLFAQNTPQDCSGAIPICQPVYTQTVAAPGLGHDTDLTVTNRDCLQAGEHKTTWYVINIVRSGTLVFTLTPNSPNDYDFAIWDVTPDGCGQNPCDIVHSTAPIRCNYAGTTGTTGLSTTATQASVNAAGPPFSSAINAVAGQSFMIVIDNFTATTVGYTINFSASTVSITDTTKPLYKAVTTPCGYSSNILNVIMEEPVRCNSIAPNGSDFYLTAAAGGTYTVAGATSQNCIAGGNFSNKLILEIATPLPAGTYTLHANTGTDGNTLLDNCGNQQPATDEITFTLTQPPAPLEIIRLDTPACTKTRIVLSRPVRCNTVAANGSDFQITGPGPVSVIHATPISCQTFPATCIGSIAITDTIDLIFDGSIKVPGTYNLSVVTGTDNNPLLDTCGNFIGNTFPFVVSDAGYVTATATPSIICAPGYVQLDATLNVPHEAVAPGYIWTNGNFIGDSTAASTLAYVEATRTYQVQIKDTFGCYRRSKTDVIVSVRNPQLLTRDTAICYGESTPLAAAGGVSYSWYPATGLSCTTCPNPIATPLETTTYYGVIFDQYGCTDTVHETVIVYPTPFVDAGHDTTIVYGQSIQLYAYAPTGRYYVWDPVVGLNNANIPNPIATPQTSLTYRVDIVDLNYCKNTDSIRVNVITDVPVYVPSGFTPNADGRNDIFRVTNLTFQRVTEFRVMNRWGQMVFHSQDNSGWDGTFNGKPQDNGVYQYLVRVAYPDGRTETFTGNVTLIR